MVALEAVAGVRRTCMKRMLSPRTLSAQRRDLRITAGYAQAGSIQLPGMCACAYRGMWACNGCENDRRGLKPR